jgi:hypothetical protein
VHLPSANGMLKAPCCHFNGMCTCAQGELEEARCCILIGRVGYAVLQSSCALLLYTTGTMTWSSYLSLSLIVSLLSLKSLAAPTLECRDQLCNGYAELCNRQYSNISFVGTHDSAFVGPLPTENQDDPVSAQLSAGVRFLQAQTHVLNGNLELCHTSCLEEDAGSLQSYLSTVKSFLDANPNEVVTLLLVNGDDQSPTLFDSAFKAAGLNTYAFVPSTSPADLTIDQWPTLGEMISAGQRLVVFLGMLSPSRR